MHFSCLETKTFENNPRLLENYLNPSLILETPKGVLWQANRDHRMHFIMFCTVCQEKVHLNFEILTCDPFMRTMYHTISGSMYQAR